MEKTHIRKRIIISVMTGMIMIPGRAINASAAEEAEEKQSFVQVAGIESVLEKCYETDVKDNINLYLVPSGEGEYLNMAFSDTDDFTYIRSAPDEESDWVGKLYSDSAAEVLEYLDGWTKIRSGSAEGYVPADALFTGAEARSSAEDYQTDKATVTASVLNVRDGQGTEYTILTQVEQGEEYVITGEAVDGWYPVKIGELDGWVCGEYITAETSYSYGRQKKKRKSGLRKKRPGKKRNRLQPMDRQ